MQTESKNASSYPPLILFTPLPMTTNTVKPQYINNKKKNQQGQSVVRVHLIRDQPFATISRFLLQGRAHFLCPRNSSNIMRRREIWKVDESPENARSTPIYIYIYIGPFLLPPSSEKSANSFSNRAFPVGSYWLFGISVYLLLKYRLQIQQITTD